MEANQLSSLAVMHVHYVDLDDVVDTLARKHSRRIVLLSALID